MTFASSGVTPYNFDVARNEDALDVTEAFGSAPGPRLRRPTRFAVVRWTP